MTEQEIRESLHAAADGIVLPERFKSPSSLVSAAVRRHRRSRGLLAIAAAGVLVVMTTAGLTAAASGGLLSRTKQMEADTRQLLAAVQQVEESAGETSGLLLAYPVGSPEILDPFGPRVSPDASVRSLHTGVDFAARPGDPVTAAADGVVAAVGAYPELGNVVVISHGKREGKAVSTWYAYNGNLRVQAGQNVKQGDVVAVAGASGGSTGPHVHFEVRVAGEPVDPIPWLRK